MPFALLVRAPVRYQKSRRFPSLPSSSRSCARYSLPMYLHLHLPNVIANVASSRTPHIGVSRSQIHLAAPPSSQTKLLIPLLHPASRPPVSPAPCCARVRF
ncbi:hypothetical protein DFH09DRAFT_1300270 [Mycena vulgaris]|nr:hypothetical protein DFH09DRAFT_1300270 [Mycena vulgaris]